MRRHAWIGAIVASVAAAAVGLVVPSSATVSGSLTRYPYLTDLVKRHVTVNWATTTAITSGRVTYGKLGAETCRAHSVAATPTSITVGSTTEYQWKASLTHLATDATYCYRIFGSSVHLLGADRAPTFRLQVPAGSSTPYSFAVLGDWGRVASDGTNVDQAALMRQIAESGARFAVTTGDTGYPDGSQKNYGDLIQTGSSTSAVFGPSFWTVAGDSIPLFNAQGNHGLTADALTNWPQDRAVATSGGRYQMDTYCCQNGAVSASYPSEWYAFDAGNARLYVLDASWNNANVGASTLYGNDYDNHWTPASAEYQWLRNDLAAHPSALKFAFFHFPLYADNATETSDPWLQGPDNLEGLLASFGVDIVFNGHAHIYERNVPSAPGMPVTYVTGGGGGQLEPVSACTPIDQYAIGWDYVATTHGSACGSASPPTTLDRVIHFLLVTVSGSQVTVTPTDEMGRTFDVQTYTFPG